MSQPNRTTDALDDLLSDFYKSEMRTPWPPAPAAARSTPRRAAADPGRRARYTLAASVALVLGLGWYLGSGSQTQRSTPPAPRGTGPNVLLEGTAKTPEAFHKKPTDDGKKVTDPMVGFEPSKIKLP